MSTLTINVSTITGAYASGTGSETSPTLLTNNGNQYYVPVGTITVNLGQSATLTCSDSDTTSPTTITAVALAYESGDHLGASHATASGDTFTINPTAIGDEEFYVIFSFSSGGYNYWCKIDPSLKVNQG